MADLKLQGMRLLINESDDSFRFYRDAIGLSAQSGREGEEFARLIDGSGINVELVTPQGQSSQYHGADRPMLLFTTPNVHDALRALREWNVEVVQEPVDITPLGMRIARLRDPAGNLIELRQNLL
ncbi:VOC family protein [Rugosimonospora acidiphila]|uniref:VOC family protein n=1 Tax=Rugosimonospora acidiphila TaxID=556531 RepID=A0ABP9RVX0_9ACTN